VLIMAAAVADFRPASPADDKIKKNAGLGEIRLERTKDILREVAQFRQVGGWPRLVIGFAAESQDLLENARAKLESKRLDLIVANNIQAPDAGFEADTNRVTLLEPGGAAQALPLTSKAEVAAIILERAMELLKKGG
jgi:phosphopantothenoylcysteine decarboxylase/phosphopantothenate--cysteine ligase